MADRSEAFGLDGARVWRHVVATAGWGAALLREAEEAAGAERDRREHSAASSFTVAAGYAATVDPSVAELLFWAAARAYGRLRPVPLFGGVLAACTSDTSLHDLWWQAAEEQLRDGQVAPRDRVYAAIIGARATRARRPDAAADEAFAAVVRDRSWRGAYLTELHAPASLFLDVLAARFTGARWAEEWQGVAREPVRALLTTYVDQLALARAAADRWRTFFTRFLPVPPEMLSTVLALGERWDRAVPDDERLLTPPVRALLDVVAAVAGMRDEPPDRRWPTPVLEALARSRWNR